MVLPRLKVPPRMCEAMAYDKLAGDVPRVLILEGQYWLDAACINAGRALGWIIQSVPVTMEGVLSRDAIAGLLEALVEFKPDYVLSVNLSGMDVDGVFARLFEDLQLPYVTWFVDDPRTILMGRDVYATPYSVALTWERAYADYLAGVDFPVVHWVPLAVDPSVFNAAPADTWAEPPAFVGNSMVNPAETEWAWIKGHPRLAAAITDAFEAGHVNRHSFAEGLEALLPDGLVAQLDPDQRRHAELFFFVEGTRRLRQETVTALEPEGLTVRGDGEWRRLFEPAGGPINYTQALPAFYRQCAINLNVTSIQMATTVNQRVFDCPAAGGFLLTDAQPALYDLFDVDREVACYHSLEECVDLFRWFRAHPAARRDVARRARERILNEHTYGHRLEEITAVVRAHFAARH